MHLTCLQYHFGFNPWLKPTVSHTKNVTYFHTLNLHIFLYNIDQVSGNLYASTPLDRQTKANTTNP